MGGTVVTVVPVQVVIRVGLFGHDLIEIGIQGRLKILRHGFGVADGREIDDQDVSGGFGNFHFCFRPFDPPLEAGAAMIWKKYQVFSKPAEMLLEKMMAAFGE